MKKFVSENWYKLMIGSSLLMASFGFMVHSVSPAMADDFNVNSNYKMVPTNADGSINVKLSDEQLNKIIPKNADGSINVKNAPGSSMDINLNSIRGRIAIMKNEVLCVNQLWLLQNNPTHNSVQAP